jgi:Ca2+-binding RTX toxin-like protein
MTVVTFTGTDADEIINPDQISPSVTSDGLATNPTPSADIIKAGGGDDRVGSGDGDDQVFLGKGDDIFDWGNSSFAGTGSDVVNGGKGTDTVNFKGFGADIALTANGGFAVISSDLFEVDLTNVERINIGGANAEDAIKIGDLTGTSVEKVVVDLGDILAPGQPDNASDIVHLNGSRAGDHITAMKSGGSIKIEGLPAEVTLKHLGAHDDVTIAAGGGKDTIDASKLPTGKVTLAISGDGGRDHVIGSSGGDLLFGGGGKDVIHGGKGADTIFGGDFLGTDNAADVLRGGRGSDLFALTLPSSGSKADTILDFVPGLDKIVPLFHEIVDSLNGDTFGADNFRIGNKAKDANDFIVYNDKTGALFFDPDGHGGADAMKFAILDKHLALSASDIDLDLVI